jgi:hypothetical protein
VSEVHRQVNRRIGLTLGSAGAFFVLLIVAIAVLDSPLIAGIALGGILVAVVAARQLLRCPLCGTSVLNGPVGLAMNWLTGRDRRCSRCRTDYEEALTEIHKRNAG